MTPYTRIILLVLIIFLVSNFLFALLVGYLEDLGYTDAFYLTMTTSTLCGALPAKTAGGKWFLSFYQLFSYGLFFFTITMICDSRFTIRRYPKYCE